MGDKTMMRRGDGDAFDDQDCNDEGESCMNLMNR